MKQLQNFNEMNQIKEWLYSHSSPLFLRQRRKPRKIVDYKSCHLTFLWKMFWLNKHARTYMYGGKLLGLSCWQLQHSRISAWLCALHHHHRHSALGMRMLQQPRSYVVDSHVVSSFPPFFLLWNASSVLASKASQKVNMARVRIYLTMWVVAYSFNFSPTLRTK
jgi:hypothetical protein